MVEQIRNNLISGQSQAFFSAVSHCCPISLFTTDLDGCCTYINPQFQSFYGCSGEASLGKDWIQWVHSGEQETVVAQWRNQTQRTGGFSWECGFQTQQGKTVWGYVRSQPLINDQGSHIGYVFTVEEMSRCQVSEDSQVSEVQRRLTLTEEALRESQHRFQELADHLPFQIWMDDTQGNSSFVNTPSLEFTGLSSEELLEGWPEILHPEDKEQYLNQYYTAIANRKEYRTLVRLRRHDGVYRWFDVMGLPRFEGDRFIGYVGCCIDITERQEAEAALRESQERLKIINERFQFAATAVNALIYDWNIEQDFVERTEGLTRILGYSLSEVEPTGNWWRVRVHPEDLQRISDEATVALATSDYYGAEYRVLNQQNQYVYVLDQALVVTRDAQGKPLRVVGSTSNISDRKLAEIALREREKRFSTLFNGMQDWVLVYHLMPDHQPGKLIEVNEQACQQLGYTRNELLNLSIMDLMAIPSTEIHSCIQKLLLNKYLVTESIQLTKDGRQLPIEISATLFTLNDLPTVQLICRDISERKIAEEELRKSERLYRAIGETIDYGIWVCDADGRNIYVSESFLRLVGITQQQCSEFGWGAVLHPEDAERTITAWKECVESEGIWDMEHRFWGVDSQWHPILARGVPVRDEDGKVLCWAGINLDISRQKQTEAALRQSEEQFRQLAEAMPQIVWATNGEGRLEYVNRQWCSYSGLTLEEGCEQQYVHPAIHPDDFESVQEQWRICIKTGLPYQKECRLKRGWDGSYRWFLIRAVPITDQQGQVVRWYGTSTDIDERKRAEAEREQLLEREQLARQEAEAANRIKDEFLAVLSHELRSPLNPILGWSKLLRTRKLDAIATERALEAIERNAKLQTQLIEDLLDVSRILRGKMVLNVSPVNLVSVIEDALETVCLAAEAKGIEIRKSFALDQALVSGDASRLQQVMWNLCSNAVKFTPQGGRVEIRLQRIGTMAEIQVEDTGIGISASFIPYVFDYFRQEDGTTTRKFGGLGLGLAIARHLTELHGGTVSVNSLGEDQGAIFTVRLPLMLNTQPLCSTQELPPQPLNLSQIKILVVDDQAEMRALLVALLEQSQAQVRVATSAVEALAILKHFKPDVLVSDIGMPDVDGYMLLQQIRQLPPEEGGKIPAIALTAYAAEADQKQALAAGYQIHLPKPVEPVQLMGAIANLLTVDC